MSGTAFFSVTMSLDGLIAPGSLGELMGQHTEPADEMHTKQAITKKWASRHECGPIQGLESRRRSCGRTCSIGPSVSMMRPSAALAEWKP